MTFPIPRSILAGLACAVLVCACTADPETTEAEQDVLLTASLFSMFDGVGVTPEGDIAARYMGHWWSLHYAPGEWIANNNVAATEIGAAPQDYEHTEMIDCDCPDCRTRQDYINACGFVIKEIRDEKRTYNISLNGVAWQLVGTQTSDDYRFLVPPNVIDAASRKLGFKANLNFELHAVQTGSQPDDDAAWVIGVSPTRNITTCTFTPQQLLGINDEAEAANLTSDQCRGQYSEEVRLGFVRTDSLPGATKRYTPTNEATEQAIAQIVPPPGGTYLNDSEPEAYTMTGTVVGNVQDDTFGHLWDLYRGSSYFLKRKNIGGYSDVAGERPMLTSAFPRLPDGFGVFPSVPAGKTWKFSHTIRDSHVQFPILGGICGGELFLRSSIQGSVNYSTSSCFNGFVQAVNFNGKLSFTAEAGAGGYCNIIIASASAGLSAKLDTGVEFSSLLETAPPALVASVDQYSDINLNAYFKTRILFWSKKWEKSLAKHRIWERGYQQRVTEEVSVSDICEPNAHDLVDMYALPQVNYALNQTDTITFPPPVPANTFVRIKVAIPGYPDALSGLELRTPQGVVPTLSITPLGPQNNYANVYEVLFAANELGATTTKVRFSRRQSLPGNIAVRHLSNWLTIERVIP